MSARPKNVILGSQRKKLATAYPHHPPTKKNPLWSWRVIIINPITGEIIRKTLKRLERDDVVYAMKVEYQAITGETDVVSTQLKTLKDLILQWYQVRIVGRGPSSKLRKEYQVSPLTVKNYKCFINAVVVAGGTIPIAKLSAQKVEKVRMKLQEKYAPRTVHQCMARIVESVKWGRKIGISIPDFEIENKRPPNGKEYINNHITPTDVEVDTVYQKTDKVSIKLAIYIGWKTGARTGEINNLRWKDVYQNPQGCWISLEGKTGKRECPITETVYHNILAFRKVNEKDDTWLIKNPVRSNLSARVKEECKKYGVREFTMYGLRRLRVDTLSRQGIEPAVYEKIMGHSMRMAREVYRTPNEADLQGTLVCSHSPSTQPIATQNKDVDLLGALVERLGLSMEEVLRKLLG